MPDDITPPFADSSTQRQADVQALQRQFAALQEHLRQLIPPGVRTAADRVQTLLDAITYPAFRYTLHLGVIVYAYPYLGAYQVKIDGTHPYIQATTLRHGSTASLGAANYNSYMPGTQVIVAVRPGTPFGIILGAVPKLTSTEGAFIAHRISCASQTTFDLYPKTVLSGDWASRTPYDQLVTGEYGFVGETGMVQHFDPYLATIRADDFTGITLTFWDKMLRIGGELFQQWAGFQISDYFRDGYKVSYIKRQPIHFWEFLGQTARPDDYDLLKAIQGGGKGEYENAVDLKNLNSRNRPEPYYRCIEFGGFLGQGTLSLVQTPASLGKPIKWAVDWIGLSQISQDISGVIGLRSATGLIISKYPYITPIVEKHAPWDPEGDYDFGGYREKLIPWTVATFEGDSDGPPLDPLLYSMAAFDFELYSLGYRARSGLLASLLDFNSVPEGDYKTIVFNNGWRPSASQLQQGAVFDLPIKQDKEIDYRQSIELYDSSAALSLLPDGSIVLRDGYGSEIRMTGGKIFISSASDIVFHSGQNVVCFAGNDIIQTARHSIDIAANLDIRVGALYNLYLLGMKGAVLEGHGGIPELNSWFYRDGGGEAIGTGGGVKIINPLGKVVIRSAEIELGAYGHDDTPGSIVMEASSGQFAGQPDQGYGLIYMRAEGVMHDVNCGVVHNCNGAVHAFTRDLARIPTPTIIDTMLYVKTGIVKTEEITKEEFEKAAGKVEERTKLLDQAAATMRKSYEDIYYSDVGGQGKPVKAAMFNFREIEDYGTQKLIHPEPWWERQVLGVSFWDPRLGVLPSRAYQAVPTHAYPGYPRTWSPYPTVARIADSQVSDGNHMFRHDLIDEESEDYLRTAIRLTAMFELGYTPR